tara:strand:+ start:413 stop:655 length:243 start_codon:yes stop_codon:yes gene_type:complete
MEYTYKVWHDSSVFECCVMFSVSYSDRVVVKERMVSVQLVDAFASSNTTIKRCLKRGKKQAEGLIKILRQHEVIEGNNNA